MTSEIQQTEEWQTTCKNIKERGAILLATQEWSDCTMLVGPEATQTPFKTHKLMLATASPVFQLLFEDEIEKHTFHIPDVEPKAFEALLSYIYTEKIHISSFKDAHRLYLVAEKYLIPQLAKVCSDYMVVNLSMETACPAFEAGLKYQDHVLIYESRQIIKLYINDILRHKSFEEVDADTVAAIFSIEDLKAEEMELYQALERHIQANASRKRSATSQREETGIEAKTRRSVRKALQQIHFMTFTLEEFAKGPARSGLFTKAEALALMVNIAQKFLAKSDLPMPPGFSKCAVPRFTVTPASPADALSGTLRVSVSATQCSRRSALSAPCMLNNKPWLLKVVPVRLSSTTSYYESNNKQLGVFLRCLSTEKQWACTVSVEFKLLAAKCKAEDYIKKLDRKKYSDTEPEHGFESFISESEAAGCQYARDDIISIEAHVRITPQ